MSETLKLRTTALGGFQRQDVVDYIEAAAREHAAQINALKAELKQAQDKLVAMEGEKARSELLGEQYRTLTEQVQTPPPAPAAQPAPAPAAAPVAPVIAEAAPAAAAQPAPAPAAAAPAPVSTAAPAAVPAQPQVDTAELDRLRAQVAALQGQVSELQGQVEKLHAQVEALTPKAEAYETLKESVAEIELDARARCARMVKQAEAESRAKQEKAQALLDEVMGEYSAVGNHADSAINDVIGRLNDLRSSLSNLSTIQEQMEGRKE